MGAFSEYIFVELYLEPVDSPDLGEHGAVAQREAEVEQPLGRRAGRGEQVVRNLRQYDIDMQISY